MSTEQHEATDASESVSQEDAAACAVPDEGVCQVSQSQHVEEIDSLVTANPVEAEPPQDAAKGSEDSLNRSELQAQAQDVGGEQAAPQLSDAQGVALVEALLLASGEALSLVRIQDVTGLPKARIRQAADRLQERYSVEESGIEIVVVAEKLQLRTKVAFAEQVRGLMAVKPRKLSQAALETLAVIAYQQPVVKSEVDKIRGVDVAPTIKTLLERKLIKIIGYQASVGQPALYGTTEEFLQVFGLSSLAALPAMRDLKALAKEPGEAQQPDGEEEEVEVPVAEDSPSGASHNTEVAA